MKVTVSTLIAATLFGFSSCNTSEKQEHTDKVLESKSEIMPTDTDTVSLFGTYKGTFPCADCGGKEMSLTIDVDGTYCLKYKYQDKDERLIEENGIYSILDDTLIETVTPSSGEKTYYKYENGLLILSDSLGTVDNGELSELYILKKDLFYVK